MFKIKLFLIAFIFSFALLNSKEFKKIQEKDNNGYSYIRYENDPTNLRIYNLNNGLTVYLSKNTDEPRIQTYIPVRAGATYDPHDATGLAHYLEHMMFKGTDEIATINWDMEKKYIDEITALYEQHFAEKDKDKKKIIYHKIDSVSGIAAKYAIANEYDKLILNIGAKGTNAYTSYERTVYINNIPSNELEKWLIIEKERFSNLVLRLFHTELEAVYEEFNMGQDNDNNKLYEAMLQGLFQKHPYGTQMVIGKAEHLKNPSLIKIMNYWKKYYVPNNMAICLSGDLDYENTISLIDKYFGSFKKSELKRAELPKEEPIKKPIIKEVFGPESESVWLGYRTDGVNSENKKYFQLIDMILSNSKAGLIDLELVQKQKVLKAGSYFEPMVDYGQQIFFAEPKAGQSLDEAKNLLLSMINKIKKGEFDDWLIKACVNDLKKSRISQFENNSSRAHLFVEAFTEFYDWQDYLEYTQKLEKVTKKELVDFANKFFKDNYVVIYKKQGEDKNVVKVDKPAITPVEVNREANSHFFKDFSKLNITKDLEPQFLDFEKSFYKSKINSSIDFYAIKNETNDLFKLSYILDLGSHHNKYFETAINFIPLIGTNAMSPAKLQQELFKLGLDLSVYSSDDRTYITLSGLDESFEEGIKLFEHIITSLEPNNEIYKNYVESILKERENAKSDKSQIFWNRLFNYGKYGKINPFTDILSQKELEELNPKTLTDLIKDLFAYKHYITYYGKRSPEEAMKQIARFHRTNQSLKDIPPKKEYQKSPTNQNIIYFVNYDMVQASIVLLAKADLFNQEIYKQSNLFNEYFGAGLSSIVFQEIRESKALAYSAYATYSNAQRKDEENYVFAFVGTQSDKLKTATESMKALLKSMPRSDNLFLAAKEAVRKKIESERITKDRILWKYFSLKDLGINNDNRKALYEYAKTVNYDEFNEFFNKYVKKDNFTYLIMGKKELMDWDYLKSIGEVKELTLEDIFGY